ncbi:MAG: sulfotransferase family 2 domain-containing protein [Chloroflexaceae bacterium]|nr:sulfotransferase family 2 domain-containing protein [Chloroflexaceae bacterium]
MTVLPTTPLQRPLREHDVLCFVHIKKTAGSSLIHVLRSHFPRQAFTYIPTYSKSLSMTHDLYQKMQRDRILRSHMDYNITNKVMPRRPVFLTMLRHPLKQFISFYGQQQKRSMLLGEGVQDFTDFVSHSIGSKHNMQTRQLAGTTMHPDVLSPQDMLAIAQRRLDECAFVGITEQFDESLRLLCYTFGWSPIEHYTSRNITPAALKPEVTPELEALILEHHQLDLQLYAYARRLFLARFQRMQQEQQAQ